jgi:hypothetical protein
MVDNAVGLFNPGESFFGVRTPQMVDNLPMRSWEIILANMR